MVNKLLASLDWTTIIVALIALPPAFIISRSQMLTARSIGKVNGSGSVQEQLKVIKHKQDQIDEATWNTQGMVHNVKSKMDLYEQWQRDHSAEDLKTFQELRETIDKLTKVIEAKL